MVLVDPTIVENIFLMCHDCGCRTRITWGDENLRTLTIMMGSGSEGLSVWTKQYAQPEPLTMEAIVALRYKIDPKFAPELAAELDKIIAAAEGT